MSLSRIHILGGPGSGKTTAAKALSHRLGIPAYSLDNLFWKNGENGGWVRNDPQSRDRALKEIISGENWIVEGVYYAWLSESFRRADIVIVLTPGVWIRHWRLLRRSLKRRIVGEDGARKESHADVIDLLRYNSNWDHLHLKAALECIEEVNADVLKCKNVVDAIVELQS